MSPQLWVQINPLQTADKFYMITEIYIFFKTSELRKLSFAIFYRAFNPFKKCYIFFSFSRKSSYFDLYTNDNIFIHIQQLLLQK